jgi:hypothetical protein
MPIIQAIVGRDISSKQLQNNRNNIKTPSITILIFRTRTHLLLRNAVREYAEGYGCSIMLKKDWKSNFNKKKNVKS